MSDAKSHLHRSFSCFHTNLYSYLLLSPLHVYRSVQIHWMPQPGFPVVKKVDVKDQSKQKL